MAINKQLEDRKVYWLVTRQPGSRGINGVNQTVSVGHHRCWRRVWVWAWVQVWDQVRGFSFGYGNVSLVFTLVSCNIPILKKKLAEIYRIFITPKNIVFPTIENLISGDSSSGKLVTSDILSDVWVSHYILCFLFGVCRTT